MDCESKNYSWAWITADGLVAKGPCELLHAHLVVGSANNSVTLYDGTDTNGKEIVYLHSAARSPATFDPPKPVYCDRGIYAAFSSNIEGAFIQWRMIPV
jgi:hypothetical protein